MRLATLRRVTGSLILVCLGAGTAVAERAQDNPGGPPGATQASATSAVAPQRAVDTARADWSPAELKGFYLVLLLAHTQPGFKLNGLSPQEMSEREANALKDASAFLPYKSYLVLDRVLVRGSRTPTVRMQGPSGREYSGTLDVGPVTPPSEREVYVKVDLTDGQTIGSALKTEFKIRLGETVVVGTSKLKGTDQALVLLLTAVPTEEIYSPGNGVSMPVLVSEAKPRYTPEARAARIQGTVFVECVILADGKVGDCHVTRSLDPGLDQAAIEAAQRWTFKPGMKDGRPVQTRITIELTFTLR
jgi:TonB family protein